MPETEFGTGSMKYLPCVDVQADLSLGWAHIPTCTFCCTPARIMMHRSIQINTLLGQRNVNNFLSISLDEQKHENKIVHLYLYIIIYIFTASFYEP